MTVKKTWLSRNWKKLSVVIGTPILALSVYIGNITYHINTAPDWDKQVIVADGVTLYGEDLGMNGLHDILGNPEKRKAMKGLRPLLALANMKAVALRDQGVISTPASTNSGFYNMYLETNNRRSWTSFAAMSDQSQLGMVAPDFELETTKGDKYRLSDNSGKIRVFMMGAITCGPAMLQVSKWSELKKKYNSDDVEFVVIYSVERHSGEDGYADFSWPINYQEKMAYAKIMDDYTNLTIVVDSFDAKVLRTYGDVPNPSFIVDEKGRIVFRSSWADSDKIEYILDKMLKDKEASL